MKNKLPKKKFDIKFPTHTMCVAMFSVNILAILYYISLSHKKDKEFQQYVSHIEDIRIDISKCNKEKQNLKKKYKELEERFYQKQIINQGSKVIFSFIEMKESLEKGKNYREKIDKFLNLTSNSTYINSRINELINILPNLKSHQKLKEELSKILVITNHNSNSNIIQNFSSRLSQIIILKKITDEKLSKQKNTLEALLENKAYENLLSNIKLLDKKDQNLLSEFTNSLKTAIHLNKILSNIYFYIKNDS